MRRIGRNSLWTEIWQGGGDFRRGDSNKRGDLRKGNAASDNARKNSETKNERKTREMTGLFVFAEAKRGAEWSIVAPERGHGSVEIGPRIGSIVLRR